MSLDVAQDGSIAYLSGNASSRHPAERDGTLVWVDREDWSVIPAQRGRLSFPPLSPDGRLAAVTVQDGDSNIWIKDLDRGPFTKLTFEGDNFVPVWSPDSHRVAFASQRGNSDNYDLYEGRADGTGEASVLLRRQLSTSPIAASSARRLASDGETRTDD